MENSISKQDQVENEIKKYDRAFLNSTLSYAIYTKNASWFESWANLKAMNSREHLSMDNFVKDDSLFNPTKLYDRIFASLINTKFQPAELDLKPTDNHKSKTYLYEYDSAYKNGIYKSMDNFAAACAMKSRNMDGTYTLHLSFRGTDTKAKSFLKFLTKAYSDMGAYYDSFKPFEVAALEFAKDPANKISKIEVSGHSLGGSMVQQFFNSKDVQEAHKTIPIEGFTYGSPAAIARMAYKLVPAVFHLATRLNFRHMLETTKDIFLKPGYIKEERITQYEHFGDLIPKMGRHLLMYKTGKEIILLKDVASSQTVDDYALTNGKKTDISILPAKKSKLEDKHSSFMNMMDSASTTLLAKPVRFLVRMSTVVYHDMARYGINLNNKISNIKKLNPDIELSDNVAPNSQLFERLKSSYRLTSQSYMTSQGSTPNWLTLAEIHQSAGRSLVNNNIHSMRQKVADMNKSESPMIYKKIT